MLNDASSANSVATLWMTVCRSVCSIPIRSLPLSKHHHSFSSDSDTPWTLTEEQRRSNKRLFWMERANRWHPANQLNFHLSEPLTQASTGASTRPPQIDRIWMPFLSLLFLLLPPNNRWDSDQLPSWSGQVQIEEVSRSITIIITHSNLKLSPKD